MYRKYDNGVLDDAYQMLEVGLDQLCYEFKRYKHIRVMVYPEFHIHPSQDGSDYVFILF